MLASLYLPEFLPAWSELEKSLKEFNKVVLSINEEGGAESKSQTARALDDAMKAFEQKQRALEQDMILRARKFR